MDGLISRAVDVLYDEGILFNGKEYLTMQKVTQNSFELKCNDEFNKANRLLSYRTKRN